MKILAFLLAFTLLAGPALAQGTSPAHDIVGTILEVEGTATVTMGGQTGPAVVGMGVHPMDVITTGPASRVYLVLIDNTELTLGENGHMTIDDYTFDEADSSVNKASYSILKGAFLYVSGLVAKKPDPDVTVNTAYGSIGIRGTRFWGGMIDGQYGILVGDGEVELDTGGGKVRLKRGQGTSVKARGASPAPVRDWGRDKIDRAVATVALKNPAAVGRRMEENKPQQKMLREQHKRILNLRVEETIRRQEEEKAKSEGVTDAARIQERVEKRLELQKKRALGQKLDGGTGIVRSTPLRSTTQTTRDVTTGVKNDATRAVESVTETTRTITEKTGGAVETTVEKTTETVNKATQPVTNTVTETVKDTTGAVEKTVETTRETVKELPATKALQKLKQQQKQQ